jgi:hypothetical protein
MYNPEAWANHWDKMNPSKHKQECEDSRVRQEEYRKAYDKRIELLKKDNEVLKQQTDLITKEKK